VGQTGVDGERARLMSLARNLSDAEHLQQVRRLVLNRSLGRRRHTR
jgi:hypothetical protein